MSYILYLISYVLYLISYILYILCTYALCFMFYVLCLISYVLYILLMYLCLMSYVVYLIHLIYFSLMLGRVMLTCDSVALVGWTSTPKGGDFRPPITGSLKPSLKR